MLAARRLPLGVIKHVCPEQVISVSRIEVNSLQKSIPTGCVTASFLAARYSKDVKTAGSFNEVGIKLPNKDQVENFAFKTLVYFWDFTYYVLCLCLRMFQTYVVNNISVQHYWKLLLKRMEDARKEIKTK